MLTALLPRALIFAVSLVGGALLVLGIAALVGPATTAREDAASSPGTDGLSTGEATPVADPFTEVELSTDPIALPTLEPDALLAVAKATEEDDPLAVADPTGFPRVLPISQFDGGPLAGANCTMASGAMLAKVAYGIATTGSMLRSLQDDQEGGTTFRDLRTALERGYGVRPATGLVTPRQLRGLLSAGFAVAISGDYGELSPPFSQQPSFRDRHAVYVDGYYPGDGVIGEAFYVIDPLHRPYSGYRGAWWPAEILERFGLALHSGDRIDAIWAFPTDGPPPRVPRPPGLPPTPEEDEVPSPPPPGRAGEPGDVEPEEPPVMGVDTDGVEGPTLGEPPRLGGIDLEPIPGLCLTSPPAAFCPSGIPGTIRIADALPALSGPPEIEVLWVDSDGPNLVRVGFGIEPPESSVDVHYWLADGPIEVQTAPEIAALTLEGRPQFVATLPVFAEATYQFQVRAEHEGAVAASDIGTFTTGSGVKGFEIEIRDAVDPVFEVSGLFPYSRLVADALAAPLLPCEDTAVAGGECALSESVAEELGVDESIVCRAILDGSDGSVCLDPIAVSDEALAAGCHIAEVSYAIDGLDADGIVVRAVPEDTLADAEGAPSLRPMIEAVSSSLEGSAELGCLTPGTRYLITIDAIGDASGALAIEAIEVTPSAEG